MLKLNSKIQRAEVVHTGPELDTIFKAVPDLTLESLA
jgi:hypothetical protein